MLFRSVREGADCKAWIEAAGFQKKVELFLVIFQLHYIKPIRGVTNSPCQQLQAVDLVISRSRTLIQAKRSKLADVSSDTLFVSHFEKAEEFAIELEI